MADHSIHQSTIEQSVFARSSMPFFSHLFAQCTNAILAAGHVGNYLPFKQWVGTVEPGPARSIGDHPDVSWSHLFIVLLDVMLPFHVISLKSTFH